MPLLKVLNHHLAERIVRVLDIVVSQREISREIVSAEPDHRLCRRWLEITEEALCDHKRREVSSQPKLLERYLRSLLLPQITVEESIVVSNQIPIISVGRLALSEDDLRELLVPLDDLYLFLGIGHEIDLEVLHVPREELRSVLLVVEVGGVEASSEREDLDLRTLWVEVQEVDEQGPDGEDSGPRPSVDDRHHLPLHPSEKFRVVVLEVPHLGRFYLSDHCVVRCLLHSFVKVC